MVSKTPEELAEMTPEELKEWRAKEDETVFGAGFKRDARGRPIEIGIGSPTNQTHQHKAALAKAQREGVG